jgi:hypothetical protein
MQGWQLILGEDLLFRIGTFQMHIHDSPAPMRAIHDPGQLPRSDQYSGVRPAGKISDIARQTARLPAIFLKGQGQTL